MDQAFNIAKAALAAATKLEHQQADFPISLMVNAFNTNVSTVLQHFCCSLWAPLSFFSMKLASMESCYGTFDKELLAVHAAIRHFLLMLVGREFFVLTVHRPLCHALDRLSAPWSAPKQWHLMAYISEYTQDIWHLSGEDNMTADAHSRPPQLSCLEPADLPTFLSPPLCCYNTYVFIYITQFYLSLHTYNIPNLY